MFSVLDVRRVLRNGIWSVDAVYPGGGGGMELGLSVVGFDQSGKLVLTKEESVVLN
jgi:hypothetical protein